MQPRVRGTAHEDGHGGFGSSCSSVRGTHLQSFVFMGQKCDMNEHVVARTRMGVFFATFELIILVLYYLNKIPES